LIENSLETNYAACNTAENGHFKAGLENM